MRRVGVFGGAFDPPHNGHLAAAAAAQAELHLDLVLFVPSASSRHKIPQAPLETRLQMVAAAIAPYPSFALDFADADRQGTTYTVDLCEELAAREDQVEYWLLLGTDAWAQFPQWKRPDRIRELVQVAVISRRDELDQSSTGASHDEPDAYIIMPRLEISSSRCRELVGTGNSLAGLVPDSVEAIVADNKLYGSE